MVKVKRHLPIDIESDILSRLPVKTLARFISVQKSWYYLISDPYFINLHRLHNHNHKNNNLFLMRYLFGYQRILVADTNSNVRSTFTPPYPYITHPYTYKVAGSFNGLACVYASSSPTFANYSIRNPTECISLWNPALRITKIICHKTRSFWYNDRAAYINTYAGFGFHNQTNDYKVIRFTNQVHTSRLTEVEIYSLSSDSWRSINVGVANPCIRFIADLRGESYNALNMGVYVSDAASIPNFFGAYCWLAMNGENGREEGRIISFDMGDEVFKEMMLAPISDVFYASLFNYKDSIGVVDMPPMNPVSFRLCNVWVMKEYNEPNSWIKLCQFDSQYEYIQTVFVGTTLDTELVMVSSKPGLFNPELSVFDIDNSKTSTSFTKDISILAEAGYFNSFTESLVLLDTMHKRKIYHSN